MSDVWNDVSDGVVSRRGRVSPREDRIEPSNSSTVRQTREAKRQRLIGPPPGQDGVERHSREPSEQRFPANGNSDNSDRNHSASRAQKQNQDVFVVAQELNNRFFELKDHDSTYEQRERASRKIRMLIRSCPVAVVVPTLPATFGQQHFRLSPPWWYGQEHFFNAGAASTAGMNFVTEFLRQIDPLDPRHMSILSDLLSTSLPDGRNAAMIVCHDAATTGDLPLHRMCQAQHQIHCASARLHGASSNASTSNCCPCRCMYSTMGIRGRRRSPSPPFSIVGMLLIAYPFAARVFGPDHRDSGSSDRFLPIHLLSRIPSFNSSSSPPSSATGPRCCEGEHKGETTVLVPQLAKSSSSRERNLIVSDLRQLIRWFPEGLRTWSREDPHSLARAAATATPSVATDTNQRLLERHTPSFSVKLRCALPLHHALREGASLPFVRELLRAFPEAVEAQHAPSGTGSPLHYLCSFGAWERINLDAVDEVLRVHCDVLLRRNPFDPYGHISEDIPLHLLLERSRLYSVRGHAHRARRGRTGRHLPPQPCLTLLRKLIRACPTTLAIPDARRGHVAAQRLWFLQRELTAEKVKRWGTTLCASTDDEDDIDLFGEEDKDQYEDTRNVLLDRLHVVQNALREVLRCYPEGLFIRSTSFNCETSTSDGLTKSIADLTCAAEENSMNHGRIDDINNDYAMVDAMLDIAYPAPASSLSSLLAGPTKQNLAGVDSNNCCIFATPDDASRKVNENETQDNLPFHVACANLAPVEYIRGIFQRYPKAVYVCASDGNLSLHLACGARSIHPDDIASGLTNNDEVQDNEDDDGMPVLDAPLVLISSRKSQTLQTMEEIVKYDRTALEKENNSGQTPIVVACLNPTLRQYSVDALYYLLRAYPQGFISSLAAAQSHHSLF